MADTGAGPAELLGLDAADIKLDDAIPHIHIRTNAHRTLKTAYRVRRIPLVGAALAALKDQPEGWREMRGRAASISTAINKYLRENDLVEEPGQSLYSLRHSFQDRLNAVEVPERIQAEMMGHKFIRPRYGADVDLGQKREWLERIAFRVDSPSQR